MDSSRLELLANLLERMMAQHREQQAVLECAEADARIRNKASAGDLVLCKQMIESLVHRSVLRRLEEIHNAVVALHHNKFITPTAVFVGEKNRRPN